MHHQQRAERRANRPADIEYGIIERKNPCFCCRGEVIGEPGLQDGRKNRIGAVNKRKKQDNQYDIMHHWDGDKSAGEGDNRE
ncbi:Uncharacterised protein [Salmonella enterica subsp. enterica serovar Bovismorbificans]|uniref:Uncharacterized protein n=1 Tax=Salmonella enterica subsp. enterica serovar Bovismorbificans TaxID=58097 RepID=A0A655DCQ1_SALET|nr:Uncharacterised protein [Salmonella enterica subsp. enterica serovar Bovismorbificans]